MHQAINAGLLLLLPKHTDLPHPNRITRYPYYCRNPSSFYERKNDFLSMKVASTSCNRERMSDRSPSTSFSSAREEEEDNSSSLMNSFWMMWSSLSFYLFQGSSSSNVGETLVERRDCSSMDTTPNNDLEQFLTAATVMTGGSRIPPWTKSTCYTEIPIYHQRETWDCGETLLSVLLFSICRYPSCLTISFTRLLT